MHCICSYCCYYDVVVFLFLGSKDPLFRNQLRGITRYSAFQDIATLFNGELPVTSGSSIVSSIEFDKDGDFFAVGGVTRKIKVSLVHVHVL